MWNALLDLIGGTLAFFYDIIPNFGVSIILLTVAISILLFPLTLKQTRSMKGMQEIQPEVKRLQKELKGDREQLNQELMALYKERGVNPAGGCLPMIVQMPIWFALFRVLRDTASYVGESTALSGALDRGKTGFLGMDLEISPSTALSDSGFVTAIPYLVAILVVVATGYYQQRQTMSRTKKDGEQNPQQQSMQTVMKVLPVVFGVISWSFPAGLVLYFAVSQIFRIGQQSFILRLDRDRQHTKEASEPRTVVPRPKPERPKLERPPGGAPRTRAAGAGAGKPSGSRAQQGSKKKRKRKR